MSEKLTPLVDEIALDHYLSKHLSNYKDYSGPLVAERISAGHSNETFVIRKGIQQWVLRRPPRGPLLPTAHDVIREYRVLSGLIKTDVPVPQPLLACEDTAVIGVPFYLMSKAEGVVIRNEIPSQFDTPEKRGELTSTLVEALVKLHAVDWEAVGLANLGKGQGYLERQLRRWSDQLERAKTRPLPELDVVTEWLKAHLPISPAPTVVHGDYRIDNVMYAKNEPNSDCGDAGLGNGNFGRPVSGFGLFVIILA